MISYHHALDIILGRTHPLAAERVPLAAAHDRILAAPIVAPHDMPPFDQALMDGYAIRSADTRAATPEAPVRLSIGRTLTAGEVLQQPIGRKQAIRIMTGAPMPAGTNVVLKLEDGQIEAETLVLQRPLQAGMAMQRRGAELRRQTVVLHPGERLTPQRIGTALALGLDTVEVVKQPRVALVAPGNELLPPGAPLQPGKKWCSNLYALELRTREVGGASSNLGIVPDTLTALTARLREGLAGEVVIILGASGRGDHDFAARALLEVGAAILFRGVATSPGRSVTVAQYERTLFFGLPGSPWAAFIGFEVFVWPALRALLGQWPTLPPRHEATLTATVRSPRGVTHFVPARLQQHADGWHATPIVTLLDLTRAASDTVGLVVVPPRRRRLSPGTRVQATLITA
jgi:molybdenum cofactor synthesis domain-containing protein